MGRVYNLRAWAVARAQQLANEPLCRVCSALGKTTPAAEIDHIIPISQGGDWFNAENLQSLCKAHHSQKTARDEGKTVRMGCDAQGKPLDANHPWNA